MKVKINASTIYENTPNFSMRMTTISAILVRHQLKDIKQKIELFNQNWWLLYNSLNGHYNKSNDIEHGIRIEVAPRLPD